MHIREIQALLASKYNTQLKVNGALYSLRRDAAKLLEAEGKQVPKYVEPRSMAIREAIRKGLREGKSYPKISAELKNVGVEISPKGLAGVASKMRVRGEKVPLILEQTPTKRNLIRGAVLATGGKSIAEAKKIFAKYGQTLSSREYYKLRKELSEQGFFQAIPRPKKQALVRKLLEANPGMPNEEILAMLGEGVSLTPSHLRRIKSRLREKGLPIPAKRPQPRQAILPYTPEQQQWLEKNFAEVQKAIKNVCIRRNYSEEYAEGFGEYVYTTLPITMARYDAQKAVGLGLLGWVKLKITKYARREFFHSWLMQKLSIGYNEATRLMRLLSQQRKGASVEEAASKLAISTDDANRLLSLYGKYKRFAGTLSFNPDIGYGL